MKKTAPRTTTLVSWLVLFVGAGSVLVSAHAAGPAEAKWNFDLVPKAFQRNPQLDMTVITEMTEAGKKLPPVSPQAPAYYVAHSGGYHAVNDRANQPVFPAAETERLLSATLAQHGFHPATPEHPPSLFIVYVWGPHNYPVVLEDGAAGASAQTQQDAAGTSQGKILENVLDRAALVGGDKFATELGKAVSERALANETMCSHFTGRLSAISGLYEINRVMDPVKLFAGLSAKYEFLVDQSADDCYYIVASAYDYRSVAENHRQLLWRTRMTVNARGVAQAQALPNLIVAAGPYLGRDMTEPEVMIKRAFDREQIEIGLPQVLEMPASTTPPAQGK